MGLTIDLTKDPCPVGIPEILIVAHFGVQPQSLEPLGMGQQEKFRKASAQLWAARD